LIRTSLLVLFFVLSIGVVLGAAYAPALMTITLSGNVEATDNMDVNGAISGPTITDLDSRIGSIEGGS